MLFSRQMYSLLKAGVPILRALAGLQESSFNPAFKDALQGVRESLESGRELSSRCSGRAMRSLRYYVSMVYVGETTGRLEEIFLRLFHHHRVSRADAHASQIGIALSDVRHHRHGGCTGRHQSVRDPGVRKSLRGLQRQAAVDNAVADRLLQLHGGLLVAHAAGAARRQRVAFKVWLGTTSGRYRWDRLKLRFPIAGKIILKGTLARFARSFALAIRSGVTAVQSLTLGEPGGRQRLSSPIASRRCAKVSSAARVCCAPRSPQERSRPVALQMIMVGEESGSLDDMMDEVADMYTREVDYELKTLSSQIEPILIVMLGILVLILALGVFLPIWDLGRAAMGRPG